MRPLQAVAQRDVAFARALFSSLYLSVFRDIDDKMSPREAEVVLQRAGHAPSLHVQDVKQHMSDSMLAIQQRSQQFHPALMGCLQEICAQLDGVSLTPSVVANASSASRSFHTGILALEKQVEHGNSTADRKSKRARMEVPAAVTDTWIELAKLYKPIGEFDALLGIFSQQVFRLQSHECWS